MRLPYDEFRSLLDPRGPLVPLRGTFRKHSPLTPWWMELEWGDSSSPLARHRLFLVDDEECAYRWRYRFYSL